MKKDFGFWFPFIVFSMLALSLLIGALGAIYGTTDGNAVKYLKSIDQRLERFEEKLKEAK